MSLQNRSAVVSGGLLCTIWLGVFVAAPNVDQLQGWSAPFILTPISSWMTLLTTQFFHLDQAHVLANVGVCIGLVVFLRQIVGNVQFLALWLACAPIASAASFYMGPGALVGASGGLMGILGGAIAGVPMDEKPASVRLLIGLMVLGGTVLLPGDAVAHITGLLAGYALTSAKISQSKILWLAVVCTVMAVSMIVWSR